MQGEEVILIFDVGKTNKKVLLFNRKLEVVHEEELSFPEVTDEDGFPCDDAEFLESWIGEVVHKMLWSGAYRVRAINFSTYGATLVFLDKYGNRLTPIYSYLKPISPDVVDDFYERHGGKGEFCRRTASPPLGMLNAGIQILWLKRTRPAVFARVVEVLHLPQYLSYLLHGKVTSEHTSIGCHTSLWDFDEMTYHPWLKEEGIFLPDPGPVSATFPLNPEHGKAEAGVGIHDSSASLVPYILAAREPFILISTGTWCISMNPFNPERLSTAELQRDCLSFLSLEQKQVKSSRLFLGRIHDLNTERLRAFFAQESDAYMRVDPGNEAIAGQWRAGNRDPVFFRHGVPDGWVDETVDPGRFDSFEKAYTKLMIDLTRLVVESVQLVIPRHDTAKHLYITGGFARNPIFRTVLALSFPEKEVYTSRVDNATSLGAALVIAEKYWPGVSSNLDLGLKRVNVPA